MKHRTIWNLGDFVQLMGSSLTGAFATRASWLFAETPPTTSCLVAYVGYATSNKTSGGRPTHGIHVFAVDGE